MYLVVVFVLLASVRAQQYPCSCSCCNTVSCIPTPLPTVYAPSCTLEACLAQCRATYPQCQSNPPYGQISAQCGSTNVQLYNCRCDCCNTGSALCSPSYVGTSISYTCQSGSCSISCAAQFPSQCISNANGQTQGTCSGAITTTSTTTTIGPWLGNTCSCMCCQTGSFCSPTLVGTTSASQCSSTSCAQACQNRYPSLCPFLSNIGQTTGTCTSGATGNTRCACRCCGTDGCVNYDARTNEGCTTCDSMCRSQSTSQCRNPYQVTYTCNANKAKTSHLWISFILTITFSSFLI